MRYADNQPTKECRECLEHAERQRCNNCEGRTLQMFIRWHAVALVIIFLLFALALRARADIVIVTNLGFTAAFDTARRQPSWVSYDLEPSEVIVTNRASVAFRADPRIPDSDASYQYYGYWTSMFDRGHLAPAADFNWSQDALKETYYFSNVCPMYRGLNRGRWAENEREVRSLAASGTVHVLVYPLYRESNPMVNVAPMPFPIPYKFVKVVWGWFGKRVYVEDNFDVSKLPVPL